MADKKKQHFVPKFYLKSFSDGKLFNIFNINNGLLENVPYEAQCYKNYFYGKDKKYENKLGDYESKWASMFLKIAQNGYSVTQEDEKNIKEFCCFQYLRTEASYNKTRNMMYDIMTKMLPIICQYNNLKVSDQFVKNFATNYVKENLDHQTTIQRQIDNAVNLAPTLNDLRLTFLLNDSDIDFITSDNPVIIGNEFQSHNGLGLNCIGFYCLLPINPQCYIALVDEKIYYKFKNKNIIKIDKNIVKKINLLQFKNSLESVFFKGSEAFRELQKDLVYYSLIFKGKALEDYNNKYNNYLSSNYKNICNNCFGTIINCAKQSGLYFLSREVIGSTISELFDLDDSAKPFKDMLNFNFVRSASADDVYRRLSLLGYSITNVQSKIDSQVAQEQHKLFKEYNGFLCKYFGIEALTIQ